MPAMSSRLKYCEDEGHFALIRVPAGCKAPGDVIAHGSLAAVTERVLSSQARSDALDLLARADAAAEEEHEREQRERVLLADGIRALADSMAKLSRRIDAIERSRDARRQLDAASAATAKMLALPKEDETYEPGGELHTVGPEDPEKHRPAADQGALPPELLKEAPPELGTEPTIEDPPRPQQPQPVAVSLHEG
jgi:hypothetical protein